MFELDFDDIIKPYIDYTVTKNPKGLFMVHTQIGGTHFYSNDYDLKDAFSRLDKNIQRHMDEKGVV